MVHLALMSVAQTPCIVIMILLPFAMMGHVLVHMDVQIWMPAILIRVLLVTTEVARIQIIVMIVRIIVFAMLTV
jgi:hypothetical protein